MTSTYTNTVPTSVETDHERTRLYELRQYDVLDTPAEREYDDLVSLAAYICETPAAAITLIDSDRQWFKSQVGLNASESPRHTSFCTHAIAGEDLFIVPDARLDPRFADNPFVTSDPHIRFYAGQPLINDDGYALGTICVIDHEPRTLTIEQELALAALGRSAMTLLSQRRYLNELVATIRERDAAEEALEKGRALAGIIKAGPNAGAVAVLALASAMGGAAVGWLGRGKLEEMIDPD